MMNYHSILILACVVLLGAATTSAETTLVMFNPTTADPVVVSDTIVVETTIQTHTTTTSTPTSTTTSTTTTASTATTSTMTTTTNTTTTAQQPITTKTSTATTTTTTTTTSTTSTASTASSSTTTTTASTTTTSTSTTTSTTTTASTATTSTMTTTTTTTTTSTATTIFTADTSGITTTATTTSTTTITDDSSTRSSTKQLVTAATIVFTADFSAELSQIELDATIGHFCDAVADSLEADITELICTGMLVLDDTSNGRRLRGNINNIKSRRVEEVFEYNFIAEVPPAVVTAVENAAEGTSTIEETLAASTTAALVTFEQAVRIDDTIVKEMSSPSAEVKTHKVKPTERETENLQESTLPEGSVAGIVVATLFVLGGAGTAVAVVMVMRRNQDEPVTPTDPTELPSVDTKISSQLAKAYASADKQSASPKGMEMHSVHTISTPVHQSNPRRHSSSHSIFTETGRKASGKLLVGPN